MLDIRILVIWISWSQKHLPNMTAHKNSNIHLGSEGDTNSRLQYLNLVRPCGHCERLVFYTYVWIYVEKTTISKNESSFFYIFNSSLIIIRRSKQCIVNKAKQSEIRKADFRLGFSGVFTQCSFVDCYQNRENPLPPYSGYQQVRLERRHYGDRNINYPRRENLSTRKTEGLEMFPIHEIAAVAAYWHVTQHKLRVESVSQRNEFI
jgi:hypothetical protein